MPVEPMSSTAVPAGQMDLDKRTYLPGIVIRGTCDHCGNPVEWDGNENYLSYPEVGRDIRGWLYCGYEGPNGDGEGACYENTPFTIRLDLTVTVSVSEAKEG